jgi:GT2 family glycosyltransferase
VKRVTPSDRDIRVAIPIQVSNQAVPEMGTIGSSNQLNLEDSEPFVSVVVLNYNGLKFVERCLRSVLESDYPNFEIIVVDNASTDGSYEVLSQSFSSVPNLKIVRNSGNLGFAEGNNVGYRNSKGKIVVFLNVDTRVERGWLAPLASSMLSDARVGGAQCKLLDMKNQGMVDSTGDFLDFLGYVYPRRSESPDGDSEIFYAEGAAMAFKREVLSEVAFDGDPFDRSHFLYYEDSDLCWRVRLRGYKIIIVPSSVVYHFRGGAGGRDLGYVRAFFFTRSHIMTLVKNYDLHNLLWQLSGLISIELGQSAILLLSEPRKALAKLRAILWCLRNFRNTWMKRLFVQARVRRIPDLDVMRWMRRPNLLAARASASIFY